MPDDGSDLQPVDYDPFAAEQAGNQWLVGIAGNVAKGLWNIPKEAIESSEQLRTTGQYDPGPVVNAAGLAMTGGIGGVPAEVGEAVLGSGVTRAMRAEAPAAAEAAPQGITAYHGSPYDFDKFDLSKIGTGEGAQAYGHGLYFAENPAVANKYRDRLAPTLPYRALKQVQNSDVRSTANSLLETHGPAVAETRLRAMAAKYPGYASDLMNAADIIARESKVPGRMYQVNIAADPEHFLDWDKPLSEQSPKVQEAILNHPAVQAAAQAEHFGYTPQEYAALTPERKEKLASMHIASTADFLSADSPNLSRGDRLYRTLSDIMEPLESAKTTGRASATQTLRQAGIPGIKYLDQGSRGAGQGTHNYVVFSPDIVNIVKKYGIAGLIAGGAAHFSTQPVTGDPFQSRNGMATGGAVKSTKMQAHYRGGTRKKECAICTMFEPPSSCSAVRGRISPHGLCDYFEEKKHDPSLYVFRKLLNGGDLVSWAARQGFRQVVPSSEMHVTIAYSRSGLSQDEVKPQMKAVKVVDGDRAIKKLGPDAIVLTFSSSVLSARWRQLREKGAAWDWDSYHPHVTITFSGEVPREIVPYRGPLLFGPEEVSSIDEDWKEKIKEKRLGDRTAAVGCGSRE